MNRSANVRNKKNENMAKRNFWNFLQKNIEEIDVNLLEQDALKATNKSEFVCIISKIDDLDVILKILLVKLDKDIELLKEGIKALYLNIDNINTCCAFSLNLPLLHSIFC